MANIITSGVFSLGGLSGDGAASSPAFPAGFDFKISNGAVTGATYNGSGPTGSGYSSYWDTSSGSNYFSWTPSNASAPSAFTVIVDFEATNTNAYKMLASFDISHPSQRASFHANSVGEISWYDGSVKSFGLPYSANTRYVAIAVYNGATITGYLVDTASGTAITSADITAAAGTSTVTPSYTSAWNSLSTIGRSASAAGEWLSGQVYGGAYWPSALTEAQLVDAINNIRGNATVEATTKPTRRWGGITGRSLVATQPAVEATLPSSPEIGIFRGDLTQGSTTPTATNPAPTTGGTGINSYFQTTASAYYTFTPAAASSWTLVWSADHTNQTFAFIATMNGQGLQIWNTASGGLKVYNGSTWVADSMAGLSFGDRYYFALKYDGTTLKSYRWDGASAMSALPTASSNTAAYSINTSTAYIAQYSSPSSGLDHAENMYAWAYYGSSLSDANLIDVFNTIGGFNDSAASANTLPTTGVLSLAEHYQTKL
jgi:hypothetical protein